MIGLEENYLALYVSIVTRRTPEASFRVLAGEREKRRIEWTDEMFETIEEMRAEGYTWPDIGARIGVIDKTAQMAYKRWKK